MIMKARLCCCVTLTLVKLLSPRMGCASSALFRWFCCEVYPVFFLRFFFQPHFPSLKSQTEKAKKTVKIKRFDCVIKSWSAGSGTWESNGCVCTMFRRMESQRGKGVFRLQALSLLCIIENPNFLFSFFFRGTFSRTNELCAGGGAIFASIL